MRKPSKLPPIISSLPTFQVNRIKLGTSENELPPHLKTIGTFAGDFVKPRQDMTSKVSDIEPPQSTKGFSRLTHMRFSQVPKITPRCTSPKQLRKPTVEMMPRKLPSIVPRCSSSTGSPKPPLMDSELLLDHSSYASRRLSPIKRVPVNSSKVSSGMTPAVMRQLFTYETSDEEDNINKFPCLTLNQKRRICTPG